MMVMTEEENILTMMKTAWEQMETIRASIADCANRRSLRRNINCYLKAAHVYAQGHYTLEHLRIATESGWRYPSVVWDEVKTYTAMAALWISAVTSHATKRFKGSPTTNTNPKGENHPMTAAVNTSEYFLFTSIDRDGSHDCLEVDKAKFKAMASRVKSWRERPIEWVEDVEFPVLALYHVSEGGFTNRILPLTEAEFAALKAARKCSK